MSFCHFVIVTRLIAALKQTVARACLACYRRDARISRPRFRKNRASKITFRCFRGSGWQCAM